MDRVTGQIDSDILMKRETGVPLYFKDVSIVN